MKTRLILCNCRYFIILLFVGCHEVTTTQDIQQMLSTAIDLSIGKGEINQGAYLLSSSLVDEGIYSHITEIPGYIGGLQVKSIEWIFHHDEPDFEYEIVKIDNITNSSTGGNVVLKYFERGSSEAKYIHYSFDNEFNLITQ